MASPAPPVRIAEVLGIFAYASDLAFGLRIEDTARSCLIACRIGERLELTEEQRRDLYYTTLFMHAGCTCWTSPMASFWQTDEIVARREMLVFGSPDDPRAVLRWMWEYVASGQPLPARAVQMARVFFRSRGFMAEGFETACEVSRRLTDRAGMPLAVQEAVGSLFEQWNGKGLPAGLRGSQIPMLARVALPAFFLSPYLSRSGREAALALARRGRGKAFDPRVIDAFLSFEHDGAFWDELLQPDIWPAVEKMAPPGPLSEVTEERLDAIAEVIADFTDLKAKHSAAHSRRVAKLVGRLALRAGRFTPEALANLRRAALTYHVGIVGVPSFVLERPEPNWSLAEREQMRLHPYHSERILSRAPALQDVAAVAAAHHERWDGQGFFRGLSGANVPLAARIIAIADAFDDLTHDVPNRPAFSQQAALAEIARDGGAFGSDLVAALRDELHGVQPRRSADRWPADLTQREVEVLRQAARGLSRKEIAKELVVSEHMVRHHLEHIYQKTGTSTRVGATLFAMENGLIE